MDALVLLGVGVLDELGVAEGDGLWRGRPGVLGELGGEDWDTARIEAGITVEGWPRAAVRGGLGRAESFWLRPRVGVGGGISPFLEFSELPASSLQTWESSLQLLVGGSDDLREVVLEIFRVGVEAELFGSRQFYPLTLSLALEF